MSRENLCEGQKNLFKIYDFVSGMVYERVTKKKKTGLKRETIKMISLMERLLKTAAASAELEYGPPYDMFQLLGLVSEMTLERVKKEKATKLKKETFEMIALTEHLVEVLSTTFRN